MYPGAAARRRRILLSAARDGGRTAPTEPVGSEAAPDRLEPDLAPRLPGPLSRARGSKPSPLSPNGTGGVERVTPAIAVTNNPTESRSRQTDAANSASRIYDLINPPTFSRPTELTLTSTLTGEVETLRVDTPLLMIGRSSQNDLRLLHPDVSRRHACIHVLRDRVLCVDLGSRTGLAWGDGRHAAGWLDARSPVRIGPFELRLAGPDAEPRRDQDLVAPDALFSRLPPVEPTLTGAALRFLNQSESGIRQVTLNRPITLIGRGDQCKIRLHDESVSRVHSSLMLTHEGVWISDLLGRGGVTVNGERVARARLTAGDEFQIGRYRMQFTIDRPAEAGGAEVDLHGAVACLGGSPPSGMVSESLLLAMAETFADMQRQMHDQFRFQMEFMTGLVESTRNAMNAEIQSELARLITIGEEIRDIQRALPAPVAPPAARLTSEASPTVPLAVAAEGVSPAPHRRTDSAITIPIGRDGVADHAFVALRLRELERERNTCWSKMVGLLKRDA